MIDSSSEGSNRMSRPRGVRGRCRAHVGPGDSTGSRIRAAHDGNMTARVSHRIVRPCRSRGTLVVPRYGTERKPVPAPKPDRITLLAIDAAAWSLRRNLCLYLTPPRVRAEPVIAPR